VTAHEIGHNLGALHANRYEKCDANYKNCTNIEYGDGASIMGTAPGEFTGVHKEKLEWNTAQLIDKTGEYELYPIEINNSQARSLKIKRANNEFYFVEYRQPINFDTKISSKYFTSVGIHYSDASTASWRLKDLTVGQEFNDPSLNLTIKPIAISSTTAKILVAFGNIPPTATPSPTVVPPTKTPTVVPPTKTPTVTPTATPTVPPPTNVQFFIAPKYQEYKYEPTRTLWSSVDVVVKKNDKPLNKVVVDYEIINSDNKSMRKLTRATNTDGYVKFGLPIDKYMLPGKYRIKVQAKIEKKIISAPLVEFSVIE
jgi:hypothetical protein